MNNSFRALLAFSTIGLSTVCASPLEPLRVSVPFAFTAGKTSLPAGDYTVTEEDSKVIMIRGSHGSAILLESAAGEELRDKAGLSFRHTGKGYFLEEVHSWNRPASFVPVHESAAK